MSAYKMKKACMWNSKRDAASSSIKCASVPENEIKSVGGT